MRDRLEIGDSGAYQIEKIRGGGRARRGKATRSPRRPLPTPLRRGGGGTPRRNAPAPGALPAASPGFRFARLLAGPAGPSHAPMANWRRPVEFEEKWAWEAVFGKGWAGNRFAAYSGQNREAGFHSLLFFRRGPFVFLK